MKNSQIRKILVIRFSSIGDIVLTTGFVRLLRSKFPDAKIDFLLHKPFRKIFENNPYIDQIITCEKNATDSAISLLKSNIDKKQGIYDIIFDLQNNSVSKYFSEDFATTVHKVDKRRVFKLELVWLKKGIGENYPHIFDIYNELFKDYDIADDNLGLEFWLPSDKAKQIYSPHQRNYISKSKLNITVAPGAHYKTKQWGYLNYAHLLRKLQPIVGKVTIIGGVNDSKYAGKIIELNPGMIDMCGKTDLQQTCEIIDQSDLLITNDTGVMHIAAARKVPVVAFFGSSVRELGFEPFRVANLILESEQSCRPCSHIGRNFCPLLHFRCMKQIQPDYAYENIRIFIKQVYG
ncbi:MAG: glycosyltransferase family 9 protein [Candidatus Kapabacteria bacterium]|nr:glycosyltransferase family 9 protein [Ignavibacteriota bacterium]MCW5883895.1 glycosyltransferase family 9 protein [Candidatus Kapabacteria bacterium]